MFSIPSALALVPSQCLVVREAGSGGQLQFFATPDAVAMASMSAARVGWMSAVVRGIALRLNSTPLVAQAFISPDHT